MSRAKENIAIKLAHLGIVGINVETTVQSWWNELDVNIKAAYPQDMYEAADLYIRTHDINMFLGKSASAKIDDTIQLEGLREIFNKTNYTLVEKQVIIEYLLRSKLHGVTPESAIKELYEYLKDRDKVLDDDFEYRRMYYGLKDFSEPKKYNKVIQKITE